MILMVCSQDRLWDVLLLLILLLMVIVWTSFTQQPSHNQFETMAKREVIYNTVTTAYSRRPKETTTPCYLTQKLLLPPPRHVMNQQKYISSFQLERTTTMAYFFPFQLLLFDIIWFNKRIPFAIAICIEIMVIWYSSSWTMIIPKIYFLPMLIMS